MEGNASDFGSEDEDAEFSLYASLYFEPNEVTNGTDILKRNSNKSNNIIVNHTPERNLLDKKSEDLLEPLNSYCQLRVRDYTLKSHEVHQLQNIFQNGNKCDDASDKTSVKNRKNCVIDVGTSNVLKHCVINPSSLPIRSRTASICSVDSISGKVPLDNLYCNVLDSLDEDEEFEEDLSKNLNKNNVTTKRKKSYSSSDEEDSRCKSIQVLNNIEGKVKKKKVERTSECTRSLKKTVLKKRKTCKKRNTCEVIASEESDSTQLRKNYKEVTINDIVSSCQKKKHNVVTIDSSDSTHQRKNNEVVTIDDNDSTHQRKNNEVVTIDDSDATHQKKNDEVTVDDSDSTHQKKNNEVVTIDDSDSTHQKKNHNVITIDDSDSTSHEVNNISELSNLWLDAEILTPPKKTEKENLPQHAQVLIVSVNDHSNNLRPAKRAPSSSSSSSDSDYDMIDFRERKNKNLVMNFDISGETEVKQKIINNFKKSGSLHYKNRLPLTQKVPSCSKFTPEMASFYDSDDSDYFDIDEVHSRQSGQKKEWRILPTDLYIPPKKRSGLKNRCKRCKQEGHREVQCPKVLHCSLCSETNHFWRSDCPNNCCFRCGGPNHVYCTSTSYLVVCTLCGSHGHVERNCPELWRRYHATTSGSVPLPPKPTSRYERRQVYCYNCARRGHYGHECRIPRSKYNSYVNQKQSVTSYSTPVVKFNGQLFVNLEDGRVNERVTKLQLEHDAVSKIQGKGNMTINEISKVTGASLYVYEDDKKNYVQVTGSSSSQSCVIIALETMLGYRIWNPKLSSIMKTMLNNRNKDNIVDVVKKKIDFYRCLKKRVTELPLAVKVLKKGKIKNSGKLKSNFSKEVKEALDLTSLIVVGHLRKGEGQSILEHVAQLLCEIKKLSKKEKVPLQILEDIAYKFYKIDNPHIGQLKDILELAQKYLKQKRKTKCIKVRGANNHRTPIDIDEDKEVFISEGSNGEMIALDIETEDVHKRAVKQTPFKRNEIAGKLQCNVKVKSDNQMSNSVTQDSKVSENNHGEMLQSQKKASVTKCEKQTIYKSKNVTGKRQFNGAVINSNQKPVSKTDDDEVMVISEVSNGEIIQNRNNVEAKSTKKLNIKGKIRAKQKVIAGAKTNPPSKLLKRKTTKCKNKKCGDITGNTIDSEEDKVNLRKGVCKVQVNKKRALNKLQLKYPKAKKKKKKISLLIN